MTTTAHVDLHDWRTLGAELNVVSFEELYRAHVESGFLYASKQARLASLWPRIEDVWDRTMAAGDRLRRVFSWRAPTDGQWACVDLWRATERSWAVQHLVAQGGGDGSLRTILAATASSYANRDLAGCEAWFQRSNRFAERMLGGGARALGTNGATTTHRYVGVPLNGCAPTVGVRVNAVRFFAPELLGIVDRAHGPAGTAVATLVEDPSLETTDARYRTVGLRRFRRLYVARDRTGEPLGAALAHRGPLGLNYSFLENRCDLIVATADKQRVADTVCSLLSAAADVYDDFELDFVPVMISSPTDDDVLDHALADLKGMELPSYAHAVWLRPGLPHLARFFADVAGSARAFA